MNSSFILGAYVFMLAIFIGFEVIARIPAMLHTPLMSGTNAIHGVVLLERSSSPSRPITPRPTSCPLSPSCWQPERLRRIRGHGSHASDVQASEPAAEMSTAIGICYLMAAVTFVLGLRLLGLAGDREKR